MYIKLKWDVNFAQSKPYKSSTARCPAVKEQLYKQSEGEKEQEKHIISTFNNSCSVIWYYFHKQRRGLCQAKVNLDTVVAGGSQVLSRG